MTKSEVPKKDSVPSIMSTSDTLPVQHAAPASSVRTKHAGSLG